MSDVDPLTSKETQRYWELEKVFFEGVIKYGHASVQSCFLINGGAIIALLTLLGAISPENYGQLKDVGKIEIGNIFCMYIVGLVLAVLAHALAYLNFSFLSQGSPGPSGLRKYEETRDITAFKYNGFAVAATAWCSAVFIVLSVGCFLFASWSASKLIITIL